MFVKMQNLFVLLLLLLPCLSAGNKGQGLEVARGQDPEPDIGTELDEDVQRGVTERTVPQLDHVTIQYIATACRRNIKLDENRYRIHERINKSYSIIFKCRTTEARLVALESIVKELKKENSEKENRLRSAENQVLQLTAENQDRKVAFSVALGIEGYYEPTPSNLIYKDIFTNIGGHYNPLNGVFTAPVRGVYYFRIALFGIVERNSGIHCNLRRNGIIALKAGLWEYIAKSQHHVANAATLLLEKGDLIDVNLWGSRIYDDSHKRNTLSGFLLYPMPANE